MSTINVKKEITDKSHLNFMGGRSFDLSDPIAKLRLAASSCFFGEPMYYHRDSKSTPVKHSPVGRLSDSLVKHLANELNELSPVEWRTMSPAELMEKAIKDALDFDIEKTLQEAVRLRTEENIRTTPQVILVAAANHPKSKKTGLIRRYGGLIMQRADEPAVVMAYQIAKYGKPIPNSLKRAVADKLKSLNSYQLAKYRMESRVMKTVDVVNLVHPEATPAIDSLVKGTLTNDSNTWESLISKEGSTKESWTAALDLMGHMALLRNLRNLVDKGVNPDLFIDKLVAGAPTGKQLPFRYFSAYKALTNAPGRVLDAVEECLMQSIENLPKFSGVTACLCDNSGSAQGTTTSSMGTMRVSEIANLTGILAAMASDEGSLGIFGDNLQTIPVRKKSSVFDLMDKANKVAAGIGQGTENGIWLFLDKAIRNKEHYDNIFVFSDMQAGHGGLYGTVQNYPVLPGTGNRIDVPKLVNKYRKEVNKNVNVFLVQVAGYQDTIIPEFYDRTYILGGWGDGLLNFASSMIKGREGQ